MPTMYGVCWAMKKMNSKRKPMPLLVAMPNRLEAPIARAAAADDGRSVRADDDDAF